MFLIQVTESAKFDIRDIRGGFDTGQLFANNNLEHKRSDHIWTLSTMRSFLFGIINSFTDRQLRQSLTKKKVYRNTGPVGERFTLFCSCTIKAYYAYPALSLSLSLKA